MENYIQVAFWFGVFALIVRLIWLGGEYPRKPVYTKLNDIFSLLFYIPFFIWVSVLYFTNIFGK